MKKILLLFLLLTGRVNAQNVINNQLSIGSVYHINSKILREQRTIWVSLPTGYYEHQFSKTHYPVIYVLDGDANFASVSAMAKQLSIRNGNTELPEMIVVGILNTDRERDFTPTKSDFQTHGKLSPGVKTGGGESFTAFIEKELMPYIQGKFPVAPYKILIGHSLGGLATANVMINHSRLFDGYIMVDPSMWWDNRKFLTHAVKTLKEQDFNHISAYLGIANNLHSEIDTSALSRDTAMATFHTRSIFLFKEALEINKGNGLRVKCHFYPTEPHMSAPLITIYDGLHFLFNFYTMPSGWIGNFFDPYNHVDPARLFSEHYKLVSTQIGYQILPSENLINNYANTALGSGMPEKALLLYELNLKNYPCSYNAYESLGDFYSSQNEKAKAAENYKKALQLKNVLQVRNKLNELLTKGDKGVQK